MQWVWGTLDTGFRLCGVRWGCHALLIRGNEIKIEEATFWIWLVALLFTLNVDGEV
ncbi:hypothetical protein [Gracilibacillus sp. YIM 98692]|uniref:hypothetical protein n=1 Tax=Gracilibacillus sp. YIM 98692 TaxID=2663532 RepID=UPI0013D62D1D|nr:hypothetical protein [Gracilibacillus sp. YIM 98692]